MSQRRNWFRVTAAAFAIGLAAHWLRVLTVRVPETELVNPVAAAAFAVAWLFGPIGLSAVAGLNVSTLVLVEGLALPEALIRAAADCLPGGVGLLMVRIVPGVGRAFPNLRSYLSFLAAAAAGSALAVYPILWFGVPRVDAGFAVVWGASAFASIALIVPPLAMVAHEVAGGLLAPLPREIQPKGRITTPLVSLRGSYERPAGFVPVLLPLAIVLLVISVLTTGLHMARYGGWRLELLFVAPVLWAALNYGLRASVLASSVGGLMLVALAGMAGVLTSGNVVHIWEGDHLAAFLILSLVGASVGWFQRRLRDSRIHEELAVRESEAKLRAVIDNAPEAIVILDLEAERFTLVNESAAELFGWPMEELLKLGPVEISPPTQADGRPSSPAVVEYLQAAVRGEKPVFEWTHQNAAGEPITCEVRLVRMPSRNRVLVRGSILDMRSILRTEQALRDSEQRYRRVVEELTEYVVRWRPDGTRTFVSPAYCRLLARTEDQLLGENLLLTATSKRGRLLRERLQRLREGETVIADERRVPGRDGSVVWQLWTDRGLYDRAGELIEIQSVGHDITERKRSEQQLFASRQRLRSLTAELTYAEERERRRLATYLHDEIGQTLAILRMKLATLKPATDDARRIAGEMGPLLEDAIKKTRTVTFELSPPVLYELGLEAAAEWIGQRICSENNLEFEFEDDGAAKPVEAQALPLLFRGTRELLMNAVKHARARRAVVSISRVDGVVQLQVSDDGLGFDTAVLEPGAAEGGFGLFSLRERLEFLGGDLEIESQVGQGSRCVMTVPVAMADR